MRLTMIAKDLSTAFNGYYDKILDICSSLPSQNKDKTTFELPFPLCCLILLIGP